MTTLSSSACIEIEDSQNHMKCSVLLAVINSQMEHNASYCHINLYEQMMVGTVVWLSMGIH